MAALAFNDAVILADGTELTGQTNKVLIKASAVAKDATVFGNTSQVLVAGRKSFELQASGFWAATTDADTFNNVGTARIVTVAASTAAGEVCYTMPAVRSYNYSTGGSNEDLNSYGFTAKSGQLVRGYVNLPLSTKTSSTNATGLQLGAISSTQTLYAFVHVTAVSGTTPDLDIVIESDSSNAFSTPITQLTLSNCNSVGSYTSSLTGANTDTWYRAKLTIAGTSPSFTALIALAVV